MGLLRMACLVTWPIIKVNHFKHGVFITPELSSKARFIAHDSAMASLCSFLCISSVLSSSTAVSQNQGSVPPTNFYLRLSLFPRFPIHVPMPTALFSSGDRPQRQHDGFHPHSLVCILGTNPKHDLGLPCIQFLKMKHRKSPLDEACLPIGGKGTNEENENNCLKIMRTEPYT